MGVIRLATAEDSRAGAGKPPVSGWRARIRARPGGHMALRMVIGALGGILIIVGLIMVPLPGPGWLVVFTGLAVLSTEFPWASRLLVFAKRTVLKATYWLERQNWFVRIVASLLTFACAAAIVWVTLKITMGIDLVQTARALLVLPGPRAGGLG